MPMAITRDANYERLEIQEIKTMHSQGMKDLCFLCAKSLWLENFAQIRDSYNPFVSQKA